MKRRTFLSHTGQAAIGISLLGLNNCNSKTPEQQPAQTELDMSKPLWFKISLAQWSLHRTLVDKKLDNLDFPLKAKRDFGIDAIEYVNQFFKDKAKDTAYLTELKKRQDDNGVYANLIMCDGEGGMGDLDAKLRQTAVENHYKWVEAAKFLGCRHIRVNAYGEGAAEEVSNAAIDGLGKLAEFAKGFGLNVIVENHGGHSSNGAWLANVMTQINMPNMGTLPDFGNFCLRYKDGKHENGCEESYDRYKGVTEMMPFAKAVSAKSHAFDAAGNETKTDYVKMLKIVKDAGYKDDYIGIEWEGETPDEDTGIKMTKALLEKAGRMV